MRSHQNFTLNLFAACLLICSVACNKSSIEAPDGPPVDTTSTAPNTTKKDSLHVYVAGYIRENGDYIPTYWNNDAQTVLNGGRGGYITDIYADSTDILTTVNGVYSQPGYFYWKDGIGFSPADPRSRGYSTRCIIKYQGAIYTAGVSMHNPDHYPIAVYGKNEEQPVYLVNNSSNGTTHYSEAHGIALSGSDVYVVGHFSYAAALWKNGVAQELEFPVNPPERYSAANSVRVEGSDVYVAGTINLDFQHNPSNNARPVLWKNYKLTVLSDSIGMANALFVKGADIYIAGNLIAYPSSKRNAVYWKNGALHRLETVQYSTAQDIAVDGDDVYVAGEIDGRAVYWKNGVKVDLGNGAANAIFLTRY